MRAWLVHEHGSLSFHDDVASPEIDERDPDDVVIDVEAAAPNFADGLMIEGSYQEKPALPFVPGLEVGGVVVTSNSALVSAGDRVVGLARSGCGAWAEQARCDARQLVVLPDDVKTAEAVAFHVNAQTAWFALHRQGHLAEGETVLVHAAAGGVGSMAIQLAVAAGNEVFGTASAAKRDIVLGLGASACFDNRDPHWPKQLRQANDGLGVDLVVDLVGGQVFDESWRLLRFEGRLVTVGFTSGDVPSVQANHALVKNVSLVGLYWARYTLERPDLVAAAAGRIWDLYRSGRIDPLIMVTDHVTSAAERSRAISSGATTGKTVLTW